MARKVAAVHRRDVARLENTQLVKVVPVEEVAVEAAHSLQRAEDFLHAIDHVRARDESEVHRAHRREKLKPDVGRRRAQGNRRLGIFLEVVRSEPLRFLRHELLEVGPVQLRIAQCCLTLCFGEVDLAQNRRTTQSESDARTRQPRQHQRQRPEHK